MPQILKKLSAETVTKRSGRKVVPLGYGRESVLTAAFALALAAIPENTDDEKATKAKVRAELSLAYKSNELCLSFGMLNGHVNPNDWMAILGNPEVVDQPLVIGGDTATQKMFANGRGGYMSHKVRKNYSLNDAALATLGVTKAPKQVFTPPDASGYVYGQRGAAPSQGQDQAGSDAEEDVSHSDGNDFPV